MMKMMLNVALYSPNLCSKFPHKTARQTADSRLSQDIELEQRLDYAKSRPSLNSTRSTYSPEISLSLFLLTRVQEDLVLYNLFLII